MGFSAAARRTISVGVRSGSGAGTSGSVSLAVSVRGPPAKSPSPLVGEGRGGGYEVQEGAGPLFRNSPSVWNVGGAFGASLRVWGPGLRSLGRRARTPGQSPCFHPPSVQEGAGPLFRNSPSVGNLGGAFGASLRVWWSRLRSLRRRARTPGQSPCFHPPSFSPSAHPREGRGGGYDLDKSLSDPASLRSTPPWSSTSLFGRVFSR